MCPDGTGNINSGRKCRHHPINLLVLRSEEIDGAGSMSVKSLVDRSAQAGICHLPAVRPEDVTHHSHPSFLICKVRIIIFRDNFLGFCDLG